MSTNRARIEETSAELMRERSGFVGRTLSHMIDPVLEHLRSCLLDLDLRMSEMETPPTAHALAGEVAEVRAAVQAQENRLRELAETFRNSLDELVGRLAEAEQRRLREAAEEAERRRIQAREMFDHLTLQALEVYRAGTAGHAVPPERHMSTAVNQLPEKLPEPSPVPYDSPYHTRALQEQVVRNAYAFTHDARVIEASLYDGINLWHCIEERICRTLTLKMVDEVRRKGRKVVS